jgi:UDP-N-acetyl-D-mannosaminuronate dehydrogenase
MPLYAVRVLEKSLLATHKKLDGAVIALLGLAYKRDVPDRRESPALEIRDVLEKKGAIVRAFDPYAPGSNVRSLEEALTGADAAVVATDHAQFAHLSPHVFERHGVPIVVDGRNCLDKNAFAASDILYRGIGRGL